MKDTTLGDACEFKYGKNLPKKLRISGEFPVFGSNGKVGSHSKAITTKNTIIIGRKGSIGEINYSESECWPIDTAYYVDETCTDEDPRWLHYALKGLRLADLNQSTGVPGLNRNDAYLKKLIIPPLAEQKRIAGILDQADALRRQRQRALDRLNQLGQSIFYEMFGEADFVEMEQPLKDIIKVSSGDGLSAKNMVPGRFPVYGGNGVNGHHNKKNVSNSTIIIGRVGVYCGSVHRTESEAWVTDNALIVKKLIDLDDTYLEHALREANFNQYAGRSAQPLVSGSRIYPVRIIVPPMEQQRLFASRMSSVKESVGTQLQAQKHSNSLFVSLQQRAFRGEL